MPGAADLGAKVRDALGASRTLVVICSPAAAASRWVNEEVRTFKALGRSDAIVPIVIDGEPNASDRPELGLPECFPPALRFHVSSDGAVTDDRVDPLAADARAGKDGRGNALLKTVAGIVGVGFDELVRREERRRRKRRLMALGLGSAAVLAAAGTYVGLADAGSAVPGGDLVRRRLDRLGVTAFRPVPSRDAMAVAAGRARQEVRARVVAEMPRGAGQQGGDPSLWEIGQVVAALYRDPGASADELRPLPDLMERSRRAFAAHAEAAHTGTSDLDRARAEPVLWTLLALSAGLSRPGALSDAQRESFLAYLGSVQDVAGLLWSSKTGGWNAVFRSSRPRTTRRTSRRSPSMPSSTCTTEGLAGRAIAGAWSR